MPEAYICPEPTALTEYPNESCRARPAQFAKLIFQEALTTNYFEGAASPPNAISDADAWSGLPDASDSTKVVATAILFNVEIAEATVFTNGENIHGNTRNVGKSGSMVTGTLRNPTKGEMAALFDLIKFQNLWVYLLDASGNFYCRLVTTSTHSGFPISPDTLVITDPANPGGTTGENDAKIMFALEPEWSAGAELVAPESGFNPLTAIVATA